MTFVVECNLMDKRTNASAELVTLILMIALANVTGLVKFDMIPGGGGSDGDNEEFIFDRNRAQSRAV